MNVQSIGILGAGKVGIVLAQRALAAGYKVYLANSKAPESLKLTAHFLAPGAEVVSNIEAAQRADVVILALPLGKFRTIPQDALKGKIVIDAMNYWWEVDGPREDIVPNDHSSSEAVQAWFTDARIVKAFSHMGYHDLHDFHRPADAPDRKAIAVAADSQEDAQTVATIIDRFGYDPVIIGDLKSGQQLEPGNPAFGLTASKEALQKLFNLS